MPFAFSDQKVKYRKLLDTAKIKLSWSTAAKNAAKQIISGKDKYVEVSQHVNNMPWELIGIIHKLEANCDFTKHLHNGDSLARRTWQVPAGRPVDGTPPFTFLESAIDALKIKGFHNIEDWSDERICFELERYNGLGYHYRNTPSPYLWSGTQHYKKGKFTADHVYSTSAVSKQLGCIPILMTLREMDAATKVTEVKKESRRMSFVSNAVSFTKWLSLGSVISFSTLNEVKSFATDYAAWIILGIAAVAYLTFKYIDFMSAREVKEDRYIPSGSIKKEEKTQDVSDTATPTV